MKILLIALLCSGVALGRIEEWNWLDSVSPNRKIEDSAFRSGREYHFFYNGQLSTGIAGSSKQHSANRIQAVVIVAFKSQNHVLMRLQNCRIGKLNRDVPNPRKIMPFDAFEDVQIEQHLKQKLERVVKFSYTGGLVHDVVFDAQEDPWSANIKRGVLNLLQVNLQQQRRLDTQEDVILTNSRRDVRRGQEDEKATFYRVMEQTLEGECETLYTVQQQPTNRHSNNPVLNVTKSINFEKCNKRPQIKYNFRFADNCPTCDSKYNEDEKFLKSSTVAKYNITGDKQAFLIEGARVDSEYVFVPFNEEANAIVTYVNQTLVLVKTGPVQSLSEPQSPVESDSDMIFTLDWDVAYEKFHMKGDNQMHHKLHESQQGLNKVELAKKFVQKMAEKMKEQLDDDMLQHFVRLVQLMRMCKEDELEQIVSMQSQSAPESEKKLKNIIPQALGTCGTKSCTKLLTQKIRQGEITPLRGAMAIKGLLHNRVASQEIINELIQLAESEKARESDRLKRHCWLTVGSLINALCTENEDQLALETKEKGEKLCPRELKDQYVKTLFNKLRQATKWEDKVLMLKTIGNAGLDLSIFELEKIIRQQDSTNHPMHVRFEAILALRQLKDTVPKKIQRILMPVIMNRREYPTIRSTASYILLQTQPERSILDQLAHNLVTEPSHQFGAFLYTQMQSYANSTNPCEKQLATDMKLALRHAKKISAGFGYSRMFHWSMHSEQQKVGLDADLDAVYSNISSIPRHIGLALHANGLGFWQKYLATLNLFNEGIEPLIRQYFDQDTAEFFGDSDFFDQVLRRHPRSVNNRNAYGQELDDLFSKNLKIRARDYSDEHNNEPKAYVSAAFKGQSVGLFPITKEFVQQLIQDAGSNLRQTEQKLRQGLPIDYTTVAEVHDMQYKVPTTLGMPLTITIKAPIAWSLKGTLKTSMESSKTFKVQAQLKPSAIAQVLCKVEAWSPIVNTGIKIKAKAKLFTPIDARVEIDYSTKPITVKVAIKPPTQKRDLLVLESRPISYTQDWQRHVRSVDEGVEEKTIMGEEQNRVSTFTKCFGRQTLGVELCARGQVHRTPVQSVVGTPFSPLSGPNKIVLTSEPGQDAPEEIHIKLSTKLEQLSGSEMRKPSFSQFSVRPESNNDQDSSSSSSEIIEDDQEQQGSQEEQQRRRHPQSEEQRRRAQSPINRRSRNPQQSQRSTFNQVLQQYRNYEMKKGYKTRIQLEMQAGQNRKVNVELSHLYDSKQRYAQVNMKVKRERPDQWEACLDAEMMFPERPQFADDVKDKKALASAQLKWGQSCNSQNYIQLTTRAERSRQQMEWERRQSDFQQYRSSKCQNKAWCSPLAQEDFVEKIGQMLKYRVDIDYQNVPSTVQNVTNKLYRALKNYYYWQTDVDQFVQNPSNKIRAEIVLDAQTKQRLNITLQTPKESIKIQDMPLAQPLGAMSQKQSMSEQLREYVADDENPSECSITGKNGLQRRSQVETFDGTKFTAPFTNCWVVLAKDCGSQQPKFVVMARKSERSSDLKEVKILTRRHLIQLTPETVEYDSIKVDVNGQSYDPETQDDITENGQVVAKIDKDQSTVQVQLPKTGVQVEFDGYAINIRLSDSYRGQQCGLCGHFDLESADEFRNPDFTDERDIRQFYMNYLIKDGRCQAPQQLSEVCESEECDKDDRSSSSSSSSSSGSQEDSGSNEEQETPEYKTKVIEIDDQLCFSTVPIPLCDEEDSYPMGVKQQKKVSYVCIDQDSQSAEDIERLARSGRRDIPALKNRTPSFTRTENVPEKCKKYNKN